jgi:hypothetical protein
MLASKGNTMKEVTKEEFFALLAKDTGDIMPSNREEKFTIWETKSRHVWGKTLPGWKNPQDEKKYFVQESDA